jgi:8-oxo-dGTP diphosphatase
MTTFRSDDGAAPVIRIVAALVMGADGKTLLVRKRGTEVFMQPGGKLADDEAPLVALQREIKEELGCDVLTGSHRALGRFTAPAANGAGATVEADLYSITLVGDARAQAEIEELIWFDAAAPESMNLAPLTRNHVLPLARQMALAEGNGRA